MRNTQPSWLNISLDAALGCRASVFTIVKQPGKRGRSQDAASVMIHPQAAPIVFRYGIYFPTFLIFLAEMLLFFVVIK
jgi:E3 ubiquitin-protein ligase HUWE1